MAKSRLLITAVTFIGLGAAGLGANYYLNLLPGILPTANQRIRPMTKPQAVSAQLSQDFKSISQGVIPSVVSISTTHEASGSRSKFPRKSKQKAQGLGSGVIVDAEKGHILTNHHVIQDASSIQVTLPSGSVIPAKLIGADPPTDLAIIQVNSSHVLKVAPLGDSNALKVGEWVLAIGSPFGLESSVTAGIISAKGRSAVGVADFEEFIQTDAAINPGNSGGALINIKGEVIGINTAIATRTSGYMGIGFAIPSNMAKKVMNSLLKHGRVIRSQLGVYIGALDKSLSTGLKVPENMQGILVMDVIDGSPAKKAGFEKYDIITSLNQKPVDNVNDFRNQIALTTPETKVSVSVFRKGKHLDLNPVLREMSKSAGGPSRSIFEKLGFDSRTLSEDIKAKLKLPESLNGVVVTQVNPSGLAGGDKGLKHGDIITEIDRQSIDSQEKMLEVLEKAKDKEYVLVSVIRERKSHIVALKLH